MRHRVLRVMVAPGRPGEMHNARPYVWRDPARCSPDRLAELAAHDDYIRALEVFWAKPYQYHGGRREAGRGLL
jgi:hypothetical protein